MKNEKKHEMTITEALVQVKIIEEKLEKIGGETVVTHGLFNKHDKTTGLSTNMSATAITDNLKSYHDKVNAYVKRLARIKGAIALSNATSSLLINDTEYTVYEAISRKNNIQLEKHIIHNMVSNWNHDEDDITRAKRTNAENQSTAMASATTDIDMKPFEVEIIDPMDYHTKVSDITSDIDGFMATVDYTLNIHNATTVISVDE